MPSVEAFNSAFGIGKRRLKAVVSSQIDEVVVGHEVIEQYKTYNFPISITFREHISKEDKVALRTHFSVQKTVLSRYGNPYLCSIKHIKMKDNKLTALGIGVRK